MEANRLIEIANVLEMPSLIKSIELLTSKNSVSECPLVLPLVGEFSSGKTTLINSLTDSKQLETATKPTTATIYEVHFGAEKCSANIVNADGSEEGVGNIGELKNEKLANAKVVEVFDTSKTVPSSIVLVDTPGLSSPDPQHKQTLVDFLPQADGILLVSDVNQQITRSITDFIKSMELSQRTIYLILTKCDTKAESELNKVKEYISNNIKIPVEQIFCVSAAKGNLSELSSLFETIQKDKYSILQKVNEQRLRKICSLLLSKIDEILSVSNDDAKLDNAIVDQQHKLNKLKRNIDRLIGDVQTELEDISRNISRTFEDRIFDSLDSLAAGKSSDFDSEAVSIVNSTSSLLVNDFKERLQEVLRDKASQRSGSEDAVSLSSLESLDFSEIKIAGLQYNLNLNAMGHEYDGLIASGIKVAGTAAAFAAGAYFVGAGGALDAADTVSDIACDGDAVVSKVVSKTTNQPKSGIIESVVGLITDSSMGKPQRRRAIRNYLDSSLIPTFKNELTRNRENLVRQIKTNLNEEAKSMIDSMSSALEHLRAEKQEAKSKYEERINTLKKYKTELQNL